MFGNTNLFADNAISVSAPMTTDLSGKESSVAYQSTFRVYVPSKNKSGSAFLHKSGKIITAFHIVEGSTPNEVFLIDNSGKKHSVREVAYDSDLDLALLTSSKHIKGDALQISSSTKFNLGIQVTTWGFPSGYKGLKPLLSVGYLSGMESIKTDTNKRIQRWVVNAAFNSGNSGGPLINIEDGTVIGVVISKLAPIPNMIEKEIEVLKNQKYGFQFTATRSDGKELKMSQGNIIADVLQYLRSQTQLVIGYATNTSDLRKFLQSNGIDP